MHTIRWSRVFTLTAFSLLALSVSLWLGVAWIYHRATVWPACQPLSPIAAITAEPARHRVRSHDGLELDVLFYPSQNDAAVIVFGGLNGPAGLSAAQASFLVEAGYGVLLVAPRPCAQPPAPQTVGFHEGADLSLLADYLIDNQGIQSGRIGVLGWSMGGATALIGAAQTPAIGAVVAEGNYLNYGELLQPVDATALQRLLSAPMIWYFKAATGVDPCDISPRAALVSLEPRPVFLIYGEHEIGRGVQELRSLADEFWIVPDGSHGGNLAAAPGDYPARILAFFDRHLRPE